MVQLIAIYWNNWNQTLSQHANIACKMGLMCCYTLSTKLFKPIFVVYLTAFELREIFPRNRAPTFVYVHRPISVRDFLPSEKFDTIKIHAVNMAEPSFDSGSLIMPITNLNAREIVTPSLVVGRCAVATQTLLMDARVQKTWAYFHEAHQRS